MADWAFADVWEEIAAAAPGRRAQVQGAREGSWGAFDVRANGLARFLLDAGLKRRSKVAAFLYNAPEYLETYFACFKAGLTPFNTNYRYGEDELVYLFDNADAEAVVFHSAFAEAAAKARARLPKVRRWIAAPLDGHPIPDWAEDYEAITGAGESRVIAPWGRSGDDLLFMYTGGTTGKPKGVMWRQDDLFKVLGGGGDAAEGLPPLDNPAEAGRRAAAGEVAAGSALRLLLAAAPLMHATAQFAAITALTGGGAVALLASQRLDAVELWSEVERLGVSAISIAGQAFAHPMLQALDADPGRWDLTSLRAIRSSGTVWSRENKQALLKHMPGCILHDRLGASEAVGVGGSTSTSATAAETARFMPGPETVVFTEDGRRVRPGSGQRGLLATGGVIPIGYYKDPDQSAETFRMFEGRRWSVPGDFATVEADGSLTLLGRGSQVVNTGGEKVFPEEVEEALKRHPAVRDAVVVGVPDERFGERVCAVVEAEAGVAAPTLEMLAMHLRGRLADYKRPRELVLAPIVRSASGKVDYGAVRRLVLAQLKTGA